MRILLLTPTFLPVWGGAERLLYEVFTRLGERHAIHVVAPTAPPNAGSSQGERLLATLPFTVARYDEKHAWDRFRGRRFHRGFFPPFGLSAVAATSREVAAFRPDVLSVFYGIPTGLAGVMAKWRYRTPMVLSYIGRDVPGPGVPAGWKHYHRLLIRAADETTYLSDYCRRAIFGAAGNGAGTTVGGGTPSYPPADPARVEHLRASLGIAPGTTVLFALQRLSIYKGVDVLIRSMVHLRDRSCVLLISGTGSDAERLQRIVESEGLQDTVRLLGFVPEDDLPAYWDLADLFVFHSFYETYGLVLTEAMRAGKAVVSVSSTAIPEVVAHEREGLLVPPGDPAQMAAAIRSLIDDPARRERLSRAARVRADSEFTWDGVARAYESIFERVAHAG